MPCFVERTGFTGGRPAPASARPAVRSPAPVARSVPAPPPITEPQPTPRPAPVARSVPASPRLATRPAKAPPPSRAAPATTQQRPAAPAPSRPSADAGRGTEQKWLSSLTASVASLEQGRHHGGRPLAHLIEAVEGARNSASVAAAVHERETEYEARTPGKRELVHVTAQNGLTYSFDATPSPEDHDPVNRVVAVWGRSGQPAGPRDAVRLSGFPSPKGKSATPLDRGHLAAHAFGGTEDGINLIPQDRALNQGWRTSPQGQLWRRLERDLAARPGTPFFVRPIYNDSSDFPASIEFGVQGADGEWDSHVFRNR